MTPHGDTATHAQLPLFARVLFVAAVALTFIVLDTTAANALDLGEAVAETAEVVETVTEPVEEVAGDAVEPVSESDEVVAEPT